MAILEGILLIIAVNFPVIMELKSGDRAVLDGERMRQPMRCVLDRALWWGEFMCVECARSSSI